MMRVVLLGILLFLFGCGIGLPGYEVLYWEVLSKPAPGQVEVDVWYGSLDASPVTMLWTISMEEWEHLKVGETGTRYVQRLPQLKGLTP